MRKWWTCFMVLSITLFLSGCAGAPKNPELASQCDKGLTSAYEELDYAKTKGFDGSVNWTKAASLLSAAKVQQQFGKYTNCLDKVKRARYYIKESHKS